MAEGARLESVFRGNSNVGSNPTLSAILFRDFSQPPKKPSTKNTKSHEEPEPYIGLK